MKYEYLDNIWVFIPKVWKILAIVNQNKTIISENIGSFPFN